MRRGIRPVVSIWDLRIGRYDSRRTGRLWIRVPLWLNDGIRFNNRILSRDDFLRLVRRNDNNHWNGRMRLNWVARQLGHGIGLHSSRLAWMCRDYNLLRATRVRWPSRRDRLENGRRARHFWSGVGLWIPLRANRLCSCESRCRTRFDEPRTVERPEDVRGRWLVRRSDLGMGKRMLVGLINFDLDLIDLQLRPWQRLK